VSAPLAGGDAPRSATTTLRLHPDGRIDLHRHGAQDRPYPGAEGYLDHIRTTYQGSGPSTSK